jgi:DNA-binding LacI/PurR family transcriptional regulator
MHEANRALLAAAQAALRVPADLSIVPLCHDTRARLGIPFAQMVMPTVAVGEAAVDMLAEKIENPGRPIPSRAVPMPWRDGPTLGPAPSGA